MALNVFWIDSMSTLGAIDFQLQKYRSNFDPWEGLSLPNVVVTERRLLPRGIHWRYYIDDLVFINHELRHFFLVYFLVRQVTRI